MRESTVENVADFIKSECVVAPEHNMRFRDFRFRFFGLSPEELWQPIDGRGRQLRNTLLRLGFGVARLPTGRNHRHILGLKFADNAPPADAITFDSAMQAFIGGEFIVDPRGRVKFADFYDQWWDCDQAAWLKNTKRKAWESLRRLGFPLVPGAGNVRYVSGLRSKHNVAPPAPPSPPSPPAPPSLDDQLTAFIGGNYTVVPDGCVPFSDFWRRFTTAHKHVVKQKLQAALFRLGFDVVADGNKYVTGLALVD